MRVDSCGFVGSGRRAPGMVETHHASVCAVADLSAPGKELEMGFEFVVNGADRVIVIELDGDIPETEVTDMRRGTIDLIRETGILNFVVDMSKVTSIADQETFTAYELGKEFHKIEFPHTAKTAVIMPTSPSARRQAEFLHTVELNRGRGLVQYVADYDEALSWFRS